MFAIDEFFHPCVQCPSAIQVERLNLFEVGEFLNLRVRQLQIRQVKAKRMFRLGEVLEPVRGPRLQPEAWDFADFTFQAAAELECPESIRLQPAWGCASAPPGL